MVIVRFDSRPDGGPAYVGPFDARENAEAYVDGLGLRTAIWRVVPLHTPGTPA